MDQIVFHIFRALDNANNSIKNFSFMSYKKLRKTWQYLILDTLDKKLGDSKKYKHLKQMFYKKYDTGFYVYAKQPKDSQDDDDVSRFIYHKIRQPPESFIKK